LVLSFFVGAGDTSGKCLEDVRHISGGCWCCRGRCEAGHDVFEVEVSVMVLEFSIVGFNGETSFVDYSLVDAHTPQCEKLDVVVDISLVKTFITAVKADVLLTGIPAREDKNEGRKGIFCEDGVSKERGREKDLESFEVDNAPNFWRSREGI